MEPIQYLLILLTVTVILNIVLSIYFWICARNAFTLSLVYIWVTLFLSFLFQGMVGDHLLYAIFAFGITVFLNNISLSRLLYGLLGKSPPYKKYFGIMSLCFLLFFCAIFATESFLLQSIFICLGASYPLIESILSAKIGRAHV